MNPPDPLKTRAVTFHVPEHLYELFLQNADGFLEKADSGTASTQRVVEMRMQDVDSGLDSLAHLVTLARGGTGQCGIVVRFLASLYNGMDFPFDLTELRALDADLFEHCMAVLRLDHRPEHEIHRYIPDGDKVFLKMLEDWNLVSRPAPRPLPSPSPGQSYPVKLSTVEHAPGNRSVRVLITFAHDPDDAPATGLFFDAKDSETLAHDLLEIHQFAWSPRNGRVEPQDIAPGERRPHWLYSPPLPHGR